MQSGRMVGEILQTCIPSTQSSEAPALYTGPVCSLSSLSNGTQPDIAIGSSNTAMGIDPVTSQVLLAQQLPLLPMFSGEARESSITPSPLYLGRGGNCCASNRAWGGYICRLA